MSKPMSSHPTTPPPEGTRWARVAPPGTWTRSTRDAHAQDIAAWERAPSDEDGSGSPWGPCPVPGVGACILHSDSPRGGAIVGPLQGPAMTWGGRALWIAPDGAVWGAVALRRPSVFAGEGFALPLIGAFRIEVVAPDDVRRCDEEGRYPVRLMGAAGTVSAARISGDPELRAALAAVGWTAPHILADGAVVAVP